MEHLPNVLASRYATAPLRRIWSAQGRIVLEREFWIAVMEAQRDLGIAIPAEAIAAYRRVKDQVDTESIRQREKVTRHDVKARIEEFCALAGHEHIHKGLTSRDLTENVEQLQVYRSLEHLRLKAIACLQRFAGRATQYRDLVLTGRTHNVAAQLTTLGKRLAMFGEELLLGLQRLDQHMATYPVRGLKGAVGTQLDILTLLAADPARAAALEARILAHLGLPASLHTVGQVYPRSLDFDTVSALCQLAAGPSSFARTLRLMAGHELAAEGFAKGQVGSSAMPHKMNSRSCERINGFHVILRGYMHMLADLAGDQWNEGDVSCSVVRRVALPDSCFAMDGLLETLLVVLEQMTVHPAVIERENARYLPFLLTTTFLMEAVKQGAGRESAHEAIKEHALAASQALREGQTNDLAERLARDERLGLSAEKIQGLLKEGLRATGSAAAQVTHFAGQAAQWSARFPEAAQMRAGEIL